MIVSVASSIEKLMAAVSDAARRARRVVVTKLKRPHSLRLRRRTKGDLFLDTIPALETGQ